MTDTVEVRDSVVACHRHREKLPPGALDFAASGHLYATHALHAFAARCPPPLARWAIDAFTDSGDVVLDVMCGSGTTLVEATLTGRYGRGVDIDPLARMVALAKATPTDVGEIDRLADEVEGLAASTVDNGWRPNLPRLDYWFRPEVAADLARLRVLIRHLAPDGPLQRLAWTVFSSLIVGRTSVANARDLVHSRHHYREWTEDPLTVNRFIRGLRRASRLMAEFVAALPDVTHPASLVGSDARALTLPDGEVDLVFFSPPYVSALDYPRAHAFGVAWLSDVFDISPENYRSHARRYVGSDRAPLAAATPTQPLPAASGHESVDVVVDALAETPERAWVVSRYFTDMAAVFAEAARVTRPGGHVVVVVCPSNIRRVPVPTHEIFHTLAPAASEGRLHLEAHYSRTIHDARRVMPYLEAKFGERMREEYVLVFCRRPDQVAGPSRSSAVAPGSGRRRRVTAAP